MPDRPITGKKPLINPHSAFYSPLSYAILGTKQILYQF
jgi:hypothetical protein